MRLFLTVSAMALFSNEPGLIHSNNYLSYFSHENFRKSAHRKFLRLVLYSELR